MGSLSSALRRRGSSTDLSSGRSITFARGPQWWSQLIWSSNPNTSDPDPTIATASRSHASGISCCSRGHKRALMNSSLIVIPLFIDNYERSIITVNHLSMRSYKMKPNRFHRVKSHFVAIKSNSAPIFRIIELLSRKIRASLIMMY